MKHEFSYEDKVMGCDLRVSLIMKDEAQANAAYARMKHLAHAYDAQFSRFIEDSELSRLNQAGEMQVSPECMAVLILGRELYRKTDKAFNPLVDISRFGYDADIKEVRGAEREPRPGTRPYNVDFSSVRINEANRVVTLQKGQHIDVGGYLKGYVAELLCDEAPRGAGVIVNLGGDIFTRGSDIDGKPFRFEIENPLASDASVSFAYTDGAIATSGTYKRRWNLGGGQFHHILDASGRKNPDTDVVSATVLAASGHEAEAYATAALVLGAENAGALLAKRGAEYCLIRTDGSFAVSPGFSARVAG